MFWASLYSRISHPSTVLGRVANIASRSGSFQVQNLAWTFLYINFLSIMICYFKPLPANDGNVNTVPHIRGVAEK